MKKLACIFIVMSLLNSFDATAQIAQGVDSKIYICNETNGVLRISNLRSGTHCQVRVIKTPVVMPRVAVRRSNMMNDPQPATNAVIVGSHVSTVVQARRDASRTQILQAELSQAQQNLLILQAQHQVGLSERHRDVKPDQQYLDQMTRLEKQIILTQTNINGLQRELERDQ